MPIGSIARTVLGPRAFRVAGRLYRSVFVDLDEVAAIIDGLIPLDSHVLDVGGGDGEPMNRLLGRRDDITVTMVDVSPTLGTWIEPAHRSRVTTFPSTTLGAYLSAKLGDNLPRRSNPDVLLICDVIHHIPVASRRGFFGDIRRLFEINPELVVIVKDVQPGGIRARLGYLSDVYITGDSTVQPIGRQELLQSMSALVGQLQATQTLLFDRDPPNYAISFRRVRSS